MEENNDKEPENIELIGGIIQYLQQKYGLEIHLCYGMLNYSKMELIKNDLTVLEKTNIGQNLFKQIGDLLKMHPECILKLTSQISLGSGIIPPIKENERIILTINIDYNSIDTDQYIYLCKTESDEFFFVMTHHPSAVVLGHEFGHLLQALLKFNDIFDGSNEKDWDNKWSKMSHEEYQKNLLT